MITEKEIEIILSVDWTGVDLLKQIHNAQKSDPVIEALFKLQSPQKFSVIHDIFKKMTQADIEILSSRLQAQKPEATIKETDVFIIHSSEDRAIALKLENELLSIYGDKLKVFVSSNESKMKGGEDYYHDIVCRHRHSKIGIALITPKSVENLWLHFEIGGFFLREESALLPILMEAEVVSLLKEPIKSIHGRKMWEKDSRVAFIGDLSSKTGMKPIDYNDDRFERHVVRQYRRKPISERIENSKTMAINALHGEHPDLNVIDEVISEVLEDSGIEDSEKIEFINDVGLDISLNSAFLTGKLCQKLEHYLRSADNLIQITEVLWMLGAQVVEYQRNIDCVKDVVRVIKKAYVLARTHGDIDAADNCRGAMKAMRIKAGQDALVQILSYLESEKLS